MPLPTLSKEGDAVYMLVYKESFFFFTYKAKIVRLTGKFSLPYSADNIHYQLFLKREFKKKKKINSLETCKRYLEQFFAEKDQSYEL